MLLIIIVPAKAATCNYEEKAKLNKEANLVEAKYEVIEIETDDNIDGVIQEFEDETGLISGYGLKINVLNLTENLYVEITDDISPEVIYAEYNASTNGKFEKEYGVNDVDYIRNVNIAVKASKNTSCYGETIKIMKLVLPRFNHYSYNEACVEHPEFSFCQTFTTMSEISYKTFQKELTSYLNGEKKAEIKKEEKDFQEKVASSIKLGLYFVGGAIIALGIVVVIYQSRKPSKKGSKKKRLFLLIFLMMVLLPLTVHAEEPQYTIYGTVMHTTYSSYHLSGYTGEKRLRNILKYDATGEGKTHFAVCINPGLHSVKQVYKVADPASDSRTSEFYATYNNSIIEMFSYAETSLGYNFNNLSNDQYVSLAQAIRALSTGAFNNVKTAYDAASEDCHEAIDIDSCKIYKAGKSATEQIDENEVSIETGEVNKRTVIHKINNYKRITRIAVDNDKYIVDYSCNKSFNKSKTDIKKLKCSSNEAYIRLKYTGDSCSNSKTKYTISYEFKKNSKTISYLSTKASTAASTQKYIFYDESSDLEIKKLTNNPNIDCPKYRCQVDEEGNYYDWDYNKITGSSLEEIIQKFKDLCGCRIVTEVTPHLYYDNEGNLIDLGSDESNYEQWKKVCDSGGNDCTTEPGCCIDGDVTYYDGKPVSADEYKQLCNPDSCIYQTGCCIENDTDYYYDGVKVTEEEYIDYCDNPTKHYCEYDAESGYYYLADGTRTKLKSEYINSCSCTEANNGVFYGSMGTDGNYSHYSSSSDPGYKEECSCVVLPGDDYRGDDGKPVTFEEFSKKCCGPEINGSKSCVNLEPDEDNMINVFDFKEVANDNIVKCVLNNKDIAGNTYKLAGDHEPESTTIPKTGNKYCAVYCKEDYEYLKFSGRQNTFSGRYITLKADSKGIKTCYIGKGTYNDNTDRTEPDGVNIEAFNEIVRKYYKNLVKQLNIYSENKAYYEALANATTSNRKVSSCTGELNITKISVPGAKNGIKYNVYKLVEGTKQGHYADYQVVIDREERTSSLSFEDSYELATYDKQTNQCTGSNTISKNAEDKFNESKSNYEKNYKDAEEQIEKLISNIDSEVSEINECNDLDVKGLDPLTIKFEYADIYFERFFNKGDRNVFNVSGVTEEKSYPVEGCTGSLTDNSYEACGSNPVELSSSIHKYEWDGSKLKESSQKYVVYNTRYRSIKYVDTYKYATKNVVYNTFPSGVVTDEETINSTIIEGLPIQIKVPTGIYDFKYKVDKIGELYENKYIVETDEHDKGRIINNTVENANTVVNKMLNNSDKVLFNGEYVCQYIINCPMCDVSCESEELCTITPHCPICTVECEECCIGCIYDDGDLQFSFKPITVTPPDRTASYDNSGNSDSSEQECNILGCDKTSAPYNWNVNSEYEIIAKKAAATIKEISEYGELIYMEKDDYITTEIEEIGSYQKVLKVVMTPSLASKIRDYNKEQNSKGGFSDNSLKCYDYKIQDKTFENIFCYSEFIDKFESDFDYISTSRINSSDKDLRESASEQVNNSQNNYWHTFINVTSYEIDVEKIGSQKEFGGPSWK